MSKTETRVLSCERTAKEMLIRYKENAFVQSLISSRNDVTLAELNETKDSCIFSRTKRVEIALLILSPYLTSCRVARFISGVFIIGTFLPFLYDVILYFLVATVSRFSHIVIFPNSTSYFLFSDFFLSPFLLSFPSTLVSHYII